MSDFHPESWNPLVISLFLRPIKLDDFLANLVDSDANLMSLLTFILSFYLIFIFIFSLLSQWSVGTILMGLFSFMLENTPTTGSVVTSDTAKRKFAYNSLEFNCKNK